MSGTYRLEERYVEGKPLGRHVNHDPRSLAYAHVRGTRIPVSVRHGRLIGVLDQGDTGSCTGNAATGALGTAPLEDVGAAILTQLDEAYAVGVYSDATKIDPYPGTFPPTDTGSDGLSVAKVLKARGLISGYRHALSLADAIDALQDGPVITGVAWHTGMDSPDSTGLVSVAGAIRGGHEFVVDEYNAELKLVGCTNSWGEGFGVGGRFYMHEDDWGALLADDGDVTVLVPAGRTPPVPQGAPFPGATPAATAELVHLANVHGMSTSDYLNWRFGR